MSLTARSGTATRLVTLAIVLAIAACSDDGVTPGPAQGIVIGLQEVVTGLDAPLFLTAPPGDTGRLFVVERGGLIRIIEDGAVLATPFLDVSGIVKASGEQGLLGLAFHPDYQGNGYLYVDYVDGNDSTQVVRFQVSSADPDVADADSATRILAVAQPYANHNGGMVLFDPSGMLMVGMGDGGSGGDPDGNGQDPSTLLGSLLRLDVDDGTPYTIPADNPLVGHQVARAETWAFGLRNPWRYSFDRATGDLYIADVGQNFIEEIDFQPAASHGGENYGWNTMEGTHCYSPSSGCVTTGITLPVHEYGHSAGCSITGGYVYRGSDFPELDGRYFFGDYCSGWIRSLVVDRGVATDLQDHSANVPAVSQLSSFGEDARGELYVVSLTGTVYRITVP